jgi:uridylate kinase
MSRVILKISGEALKENNLNVSKNKLNIVLETVKLLKNNHHQVGIVIGGGNFLRGREHDDMNKVTADTIGMLGTVMNALYLKDYLEKNGITALVSTPFVFPDLLPNYSFEELKNKYDDNIVIFGGGIGKSGFSTDSGVIHATSILDADLIIKMTNVDGVYDSDPKINPNAIKYNRISFQEVLDKDLKVMDQYAIKKCMDKNIKILVMNFNKYNEILDFFDGKEIGTLIGEL